MCMDMCSTEMGSKYFLQTKVSCQLSLLELMITNPQNPVVLQFRAVDCQNLLNYQTNKTREQDSFPLSSAHCQPSFIQDQPGSVNVEAGVVAGKWRAPLRLCLHRWPLVNDRDARSRSSVYAVIKHSKPSGWQQAHSLAPRCYVENKTHLTL